MFNYYGSKSKIVHLYPTPKFDDINEVFAGSARYSLRFWDRNITIIDKYKPIIKIWEYLQKCSKNDILNLPKLKQGDFISNLGLRESEVLFLQYITQHGTVGGYKVSEWGARDYEQNKIRISKELYKIRKWKIICGDYRELENKNATWFIDPPYQFGGHKYKESNKNINYKELAEWCKRRNGQSIVCENTKAEWMRFKPMKQMRGIQFETTEAIWSNYETAFDWQQMSMF